VVVVKGELDRLNMVQRRISEVGFRFGVAGQQSFHHRGQGLDFRDRLQTGKDTFDLIKHGAENGVFHNQSRSNCGHA